MSFSGSPIGNKPNLHGQLSSQGAAEGLDDARVADLLSRSRGGGARGTEAEKLSGNEQTVLAELKAQMGAGVDEVDGVSAARQAEIAAAAQKMLGGTKLPPVAAPGGALTAEDTQGATTFMNNFNTAMDGSMRSVEGASSQVTLSAGALSEVSADAMLAEFLKLEIDSPLNNPENHHKLNNLLSELKQKGIKDAQKKAETAEKMKKEAQEYAQNAKIIGTIVSVAIIIASIVLAAVTMGATAALVVGACVLAGALIGGIVAASTGDGSAESILDGALMGASIGAAVGGLAAGPVAAASKAAEAASTSAAKAAQQAAEQAAKKGATEATKQAAKTAAEAAKTAADDAAKIATKEAGKKGATEATKQAAKAAEEASKQATQAAADVAKGSFKAGAKGFEAASKSCAKAVTCSMEGARSAYAGAVGMMTAGEGAYKAGSNLNTAQLTADAQAMDNESKRMRNLLALFQEGIEDSHEMIKMIMESKNKATEAVIKMGQAHHASSMKNISTMLSK